MLELDLAMALEARQLHVIDVKAAIRTGGVVDSLDAIAPMADVLHATVQLIDVKARVRGGRVVGSLAALDATPREIVDVKAGVRGGSVVDSLDAFIGVPADALVALQLIDVKAHVLGGLA